MTTVVKIFLDHITVINLCAVLVHSEIDVMKKKHKPTKTMAWAVEIMLERVPKLSNFMVMYYKFESINDRYCSYNFSHTLAHYFTNRNPK